MKRNQYILVRRILCKINSLLTKSFFISIFSKNIKVVGKHSADSGVAKSGTAICIFVDESNKQCLLLLFSCRCHNFFWLINFFQEGVISYIRNAWPLVHISGGKYVSY